MNYLRNLGFRLLFPNSALLEKTLSNSHYIQPKKSSEDPISNIAQEALSHLPKKDTLTSFKYNLIGIGNFQIGLYFNFANSPDSCALDELEEKIKLEEQSLSSLSKSTDSFTRLTDMEDDESEISDLTDSSTLSSRGTETSKLELKKIEQSLTKIIEKENKKSPFLRLASKVSHSILNTNSIANRAKQLQNKVSELLKQLEEPPTLLKTKEITTEELNYLINERKYEELMSRVKNSKIEIKDKIHIFKLTAQEAAKQGADIETVKALLSYEQPENVVYPQLSIICFKTKRIQEGFKFLQKIVSKEAQNECLEAYYEPKIYQQLLNYLNSVNPPAKEEWLKTLANSCLTYNYLDCALDATRNLKNTEEKESLLRKIIDRSIEKRNDIHSAFNATNQLTSTEDEDWNKIVQKSFLLMKKYDKEILEILLKSNRKIKDNNLKKSNLEKAKKQTLTTLYETGEWKVKGELMKINSQDTSPNRWDILLSIPEKIEDDFENTIHFFLNDPELKLEKEDYGNIIKKFSIKNLSEEKTDAIIFYLTRKAIQENKDPKFIDEIILKNIPSIIHENDEDVIEITKNRFLIHAFIEENQYIKAAEAIAYLPENSAKYQLESLCKEIKERNITNLKDDIKTIIESTTTEIYNKKLTDDLVKILEKELG